jgi:hypothetical protein
LSVHISALTPDESERAVTIGGTRAGKSALTEWQMRHVSQSRPACMQALVDSKPRFRAETERGPFRKGRRSAAYRYEHWSKGPVVPNSVVVDIWDDHPFRGLWKRPGEIAILQGETYQEWRRILALLNAFVSAQIKGRERRMIVDEVLDFYQRNSWGIDPKNDVFYRAARAGGERNIGIDLGAHQVAGLPPLILKMCSRLTLFHLRSDLDMKILQRHFGITDAESPNGKYVFRQWKIDPGGTVSRPFTGRVTDYPESYLKQLSRT